ncbi:MAG: hypothetical protein LUD27_05900 [Clostridia bacterium]|nr:hypothetical protein [Clostridia bacterium]
MPKKVVKGIMLAVYAAMLAGETVKQIVAFTAEGGYDLWMAPMHFSSTFYITVGFVLLGGKRLKHIGQSVLLVSGLMLFAMIAFSPYSIFGAEPEDIFKSADSIYGYFFHMAVILQLAVMIAGGEYKPKLYDPAIFAAFALVYGCIAVPFSIKTQLNFANILQFSALPFMDSIRENYGHAVYLIVYYLGVCAIGAAIIYVYYLLYRLFEKRKRRFRIN